VVRDVAVVSKADMLRDVQRKCRIGARPIACGEGWRDDGAGPGGSARRSAASTSRRRQGCATGLLADRAALGMQVEDVFTQNRRLWVRLRDKGGKPHAMPCHHNLETYLTAYTHGAGLAEDPKTPLFRTIGRGTALLTRTPLPQANAHAMIGRRAATAGISTRLGNHSFRAIGSTAYPKNGATLEKAARMANHAGTRTTQRNDRPRDELSLDEVERTQESQINTDYTD
jgi:hypothetical protein